MRKKKKLNLYLALVIVLFLIGVGYAVLNANLTITGTSGIASASWDVHFDALHVEGGSVEIDTDAYASAAAAKIDESDDTKVSYNVMLSQPGDFYEFTVKAVNEGSIDAMVDTVVSTIKVNNEVVNTLPTWLEYSATYSDGVEIKKYDLLHANDEEVYRVRVAFKSNISNAQFDDATGSVLSLVFDVNYIQKDDHAKEVNHARYSANLYDANTEGYNQIHFNQAISQNVFTYGTAREAMDAFKTSLNDGVDRTYCLKHIINNHLVNKSYVVFTITNDMVSSYPYLTAGTYELRGGVDESGLSAADQEVFNSNKSVLQTAFGESPNGYCVDNGNNYNCTTPIFRGDAGVTGNVDAGSYTDWYCIVYSGGSSHCNHW